MSFIFINGRYQSDISNPGVLLDYVTIDGDLFTINLPKNFRSSEPIYLVHINKDKASTPLRHLIIADENSEAIVVETYQGRCNLVYVNEIEMNICLKSSAHLHYYKWQQEGNQATHHARFLSEQASDSYLGTYHVARGANDSSDHFYYSLVGEGSTCESIGFYDANQKQTMKIDSRIQHLSSYTNSRQLYKGVANDQAHTAFTGIVMVNPDIKEICAHQKNNNLLLSSQAEMDTRPELEIYSDDVLCSHGATVGQLDEEALFYFRSRGVDEETARALLTEGFSNEVFDAFPDLNVVEMMRSIRV